MMEKSKMNIYHFLKRNTVLLLTLIVCLTPEIAMAQRGKLFNTDNQLSSNFATQVFQDDNGYIWITTRNGLNVYDGYNFTVMKKDGENGRKLNTNYINCIAQDQVGHILLGTNKGLLFYDGNQFETVAMHNEQDKPVTTYVTNICRRKNGEVAVGTSGFGLYILKEMESNHQATAVKRYGDKLKYIRRMTEDHKGNLWIVTEGGQLYRMDKSGKIWGNFSGISGLQVLDIKEDYQGKFYLATKEKGIFQMTPGSTVFTHIDGIYLPSSQVLYVSRDNKLYIGCDGDGISVYNPKTGILTQNPFFSAQTNLAKSKVQSIIEDRQGNIWFSMLQRGVFMQPQTTYDFGYMGFRLGNRNLIGDNCVTAVLLDQNHNLWVGTDKDGLYKLGIDGETLQGHYLANLTILSLAQDKNGRIWIGTYNDGLGYLDAAGSYHRVDIKGLGSAGVFDIKCDKQGCIWIATMGAGLACIPAQGTPILHKVKKRADNNNHINSIPNDYLAKIAFSKDEKRVYVATSIGLACLDRTKNSWVSTFGGTNVLHKGCFSHSIFVDSKDRVWYGTEDGTYCYKPGNWAKPIHYTTQQGLTDNSIASITEDIKGRIWIGTTNGLNKLNVETGNVTKFYVENGIQSDEFSDGCACTSVDKRFIVMGGTGGISWFDATKVKQHPWKATVKVSGFLVGNKPVLPATKSGIWTINTSWTPDNDQYDLAHDDNTFTLQLSTLTYDNVEQIVYAYSINGEEWHKVQAGMNEISFSHLPAGNYHFKVKAICNGYETPVKNFTITIHPAWYASIWAQLVYLMGLIGLCVLYMKHRKRKEEDRLLLQKHIHAEEMGEAKLKFFMNISHEIRTPLTLILTPLLSLIKEDTDPHRQGIYDMIRKNSERILHLINQMMDLRKIDKGQMVMHMSETDMVAFVNDEHKLFEQQAEAKNITFTFEHADEHLPVWIDRDNFDKVLMNVLSNAFKFTPAGGRIRITLSHSPHHARIAIKDSGKGIDKDKLETIFQRFYQSPTSANDRNVGTGIGLDLTRSLVELHYGTITASNNLQLEDADWKEGSEFLITLPLGKGHLKPEEIMEEKIEERDSEKMLELNSDEDTEQQEQPAIEANKPVKGTAESSSKYSIAIVEDDDAILDYLQQQLKNLFHIATYHNGKEALPEIIKQKPDLVISDIMMPEMDGNTLCAKLKANVNTNHIPVILLTAMSREEDQLAGLQTGADAYLIKPFNMDILRRTIINLLNVRRTLRNKFTGNESQMDKVQQIEIESPDNTLMKQVMKVINENINNEDLSVDMIAKTVGISRVHLHRKMKELTNQTPHTFIRNVRLQQAAKLLRESKQSVAEVMYACGFSNAASFSTMFKNTYGCSPREYMNGEQK